MKKLVVSKDAGGAVLLSSYLNLNKLKFDACLEEPAKNIFKKKFKKINLINYKNILKNIQHYDEALIGTGVKKFEIKVLNAIKDRIMTKSFVDHWCFYKERFLFNRKKYIFPDKIVAHDHYSKKELKKKFPHQKVILIQNPFWKEQIKKYRQRKNTKSSNTILLLISSLKEKDFNKKTINIFLKNLKKKKFNGFIIIRPHPLDIKKNFIKIFPYLRFLKFKISKNNDIGKDISLSKNIIGFKTSSLVLAKMFKKDVYSFHKKKLLKISIPHCSIKHIDKIKF
ncbi:MAG: hypothetical protein CMC83_07220 [Flavobacteriaceae bacterium]|nr:hypothetical protein [Flavobacteriaceae bacterium]